MFTPRQTRAGPKTLGNKRLVVVDGRNGIETSRHCSGTIWISEHRDLFGSEKKTIARRIIVNISRSSLGTKPFAELSLVELGLFCQLLRGRPANLGECGVNLALTEGLAACISEFRVGCLLSAPYVSAC